MTAERIRQALNEEHYINHEDTPFGIIIQSFKLVLTGLLILQSLNKQK